MPSKLAAGMGTESTALAAVSSSACPVCGKAVDIKSRFVVVTAAGIKIYCSEACRKRLVAVELPPPAIAEPPPRRAKWWLLAAGAAVGGTFAALSYLGVLGAEDKRIEVPLPIVRPANLAQKKATQPARPSPEEEAKKAEQVLLAELAQDAWIHPLAGPVRRMPVNHTQAFGAARAVDPLPECLSGHCGVDLASEGIWGEPVHAVHDGVVDWVNRGPNEEHGGIFVKLAHKNGELYTWYFHLAAVPRWVVPGAKVRLGQVIGLVGDTGVKRSAPHLHFAMTVKTPGMARERYIDPESLVAIWPLWVPGDPANTNASVMTAAPPGKPARGPDHRKPKRTAEPTPAEDHETAGSGSAADPAPADAAAN
jgi:murein DD-endopeptidase MepM/ murein hydrolase activator NlpD